MYGAMLGDIVGSKYEFNNIKTKDFPLFSQGCRFTDDTVMTVAVAKAILTYLNEHPDAHKPGDDFAPVLIQSMQSFGQANPTAGYGMRFATWLTSSQPTPYYSYGNGSAMRASPCGLIATSLEEALSWARASAEVTHNHPEGIKGAEEVAAAIYLAKAGKTRAQSHKEMTQRFDLQCEPLDEIRPGYSFDVSCQGSVPQALEAFWESRSCEDAVRNAVSIGGDSDTIGAIAGSIAWTYYTVQSGSDAWTKGQLPPELVELKTQVNHYLPQEFIQIAAEFDQLCRERWAPHLQTR
jgi:ADP-ribosylglycohydrolase